MDTIRKLADQFEAYYDPSFVSNYVRTFCSEEAEEGIRQADMLLNNTFVFTDKWDMEPCAVPYAISLNDWGTSPNGDSEWVFMLNRHDFLKKLWQAYILTGDDRYTQKLRHFIFDWIEKNPLPKRVPMPQEPLIPASGV